MDKKYHIGMYGGKFLPFHLGHRYCVEFAAAECDIVYVILFYGGPEEEIICRENPAVWLSADERKRRVEKLCREMSGRECHPHDSSNTGDCDEPCSSFSGKEKTEGGICVTDCDLVSEREMAENLKDFEKDKNRFIGQAEFAVDANSKLSEYSTRIIPAFIDISKLRLPDGTEDWEAETPLVREICGDRLDAVYSSEPSYGAYFSQAYPEAVHRLVDVPRVHYPISGTAIRGFTDQQERDKWMI